MAGTSLRVVGLQESLVGLGCLLFLAQSLTCHSTHNLDTSLILIKIFRPGIGSFPIHIQQHLRPVNPIDRLSIAPHVDISKTGIDRTNDGFLKTAAGAVRLPTVGIMSASGQKTLIGLFVLSKIQLAAADVIQQNGIVDIGTNAGSLHFLHGRNGDTERSLEVTFHKQQLRQPTGHLVIVQLVYITLYLVLDGLPVTHLRHAILSLPIISSSPPAIGIERRDVASFLKTVYKYQHAIVVFQHAHIKKQTIRLARLDGLYILVRLTT